MIGPRFENTDIGLASVIYEIYTGFGENYKHLYMYAQ